MRDHLASVLRYSQNGLDAWIEKHVVLHLETFLIEELGATRCQAQQ